MFQKLIKNLPFNPSLIDSVSFYAKRMKQEESIRRLGFGFMALAMFIQMFAVMAPPEPTLAASANDIIRGGFANRDQAVLHCLNQASDFPKILHHLGINCDDIARSSTRTIRSTDYGGQLYSMGRIARGAVGKNNKPTDEYSLNIAGRNYYMRKLNSFDSYSHSSYKALVGTTSSGKAFMILFNCGNPVLVGRNATLPPVDKAPPPPPPPAPKPTPTDNASCEVITSPRSVKRGQSFTATIRVKNSGNTSWDPAKGYILGSQDPRDNMNWGKNRVSLPRVVSPGSSQDITSTFSAPVSPGTYNFSWQMLQSGVKWFGQSCTKPINITMPDEPTPKDVCPEIPGIQTNISECKPCEESESDEDILSCLITSKVASNKTQSIQDANGTTANAGDEIRYTLSVTNSGKIAIKDFVFEEQLTDVLEYADLKEYGNGTINEDILRWPKENIQPGQTVTKEFLVKIKDPIPQTPKSASDPTSFDLTMTNVFYGITVNIYLPSSPGKTTEQVVTTLPNTGPGTSAVIGFALTSFIAYFFARSRLLNKELEIIKTDFAHSGGI